MPVGAERDRSHGPTLVERLPIFESERVSQTSTVPSLAPTASVRPLGLSAMFDAWKAATECGAPRSVRSCVCLLDSHSSAVRRSPRIERRAVGTDRLRVDHAGVPRQRSHDSVSSHIPQQRAQVSAPYRRCARRA